MLVRSGRPFVGAAVGAGGMGGAWGIEVEGGCGSGEEVLILLALSLVLPSSCRFGGAASCRCGVDEDDGGAV